MKTITTLISMLLMLVLFTSCDEDTTEPVTPPASVIVPLTVGYQWTYTDSSFDGNHNLTGVDSSKLGITGKTTINYNGQNLEVFYWNWIDKLTNQPTAGKWLCRNESDGLNQYGGQIYDSNFVLSKSLSIKYPVNIGDTWKKINYTYNDSSFFINDTLTMTCISTNEIFRTPIGNLECHVYKYSRYGYDTYLYYSKNMGHVGLISKTNGIITHKRCLISKNVTKFATQNSRKDSSQNQKKEIYSEYGIKLN